MSRDVRGACALYYSYQVKGADGTIKVPFRRRTAHSFVIAYAKYLYIKMVGAVDQSLTDTGGTGRTIPSRWAIKTNIASGSNAYGLVVGTGTNAVALADTKLQTIIAHGTGSGQLQYGASVVNAPSSDSTSTSLIMTRPFSNASSGSITINEIGIYALINNFNFCIVRDLATIVLAVGDVLTLNYILKTTA